MLRHKMIAMKPKMLSQLKRQKHKFLLMTLRKKLKMKKIKWKKTFLMNKTKMKTNTVNLDLNLILICNSP
jgi:hypothetical protein